MSEFCKGQVFSGYHYFRCAKKATRDGYCGTHHPDSEAKRKAKRDASYQSKQAQWKADAERRDWERKAVDACAGMSDPAEEIARLKALDAVVEPYSKSLEALRAERDALLAENHRLGAEIDALREARP